MTDECKATMKINFVREYGVDTRWCVIVSDFIDELKGHFEYLNIREVARKLESSSAIDRWQKYDPTSKFTAHLIKIIRDELALESYYRWVDSFPPSLEERLGGYVGPRLKHTKET